MPTFSANLNLKEEFSEVHRLYDWDKFLLDLMASNGGKGLTLKKEQYLRAIALDVDRGQIIEKLSIQPDTLRGYISEVYGLIKVLFGIEIESKMTEKKARSLILGKYKKSTLSGATFAQKIEADYEIDENESLEEISLANEYAWQTLDEVQPYIEKFYKLCESEDYTEAFYTIFDTDDYNNCVHKFLSSHGYLNTVIDLFRQLIECWVPRKSEKWEFLTTLTCLGDAYNRMSHYETAIDYFQNCLKIAIEIDDLDYIAGSYVNLGLARYALEAYKEALDDSREGLKIAREIGLKDLEAKVLNNIGLIYSDLGEHYLAVDYYHFSLEIEQKTDDLAGKAGSLINIGSIHRKLQQYEQAILYIQEGIEAARQSHHKQFEANGWFDLALVLTFQYQFPDAVLAYEKACILYKQMEMFDHAEDCEEAISQIERSC